MESVETTLSTTLTFFLFHLAMTSCQITGSFQESILTLRASSEPVKK